VSAGSAYFVIGGENSIDKQQEIMYLTASVKNKTKPMIK